YVMARHFTFSQLLRIRRAGRPALFSWSGPPDTYPSSQCLPIPLSRFTMSILCPCAASSSGASSGAEAKYSVGRGNKLSAEQVSRQIDRQLKADRELRRHERRILLLGTAASGKSTFLRSMRIIHEDRFSEQELLSFKSVIYCNIWRGLMKLLYVKKRLGIRWENNKTGVPAVKALLALEKEIGHSALMACGLREDQFLRAAPFIQVLWCDAGVREAFERRHSVPGDEEFKDGELQSVIYIIACSTFNETYTKASGELINKLDESFLCLRHLLDVKSELFTRDMNLIVFFNKDDLFSYKIASLRVDYSKFDSTFPADRFDPLDLGQVREHLIRRLTTVVPPNRQLRRYTHFTTSIDLSNVRRVFRDIRDTVMLNFLREALPA
uniref:G-protein alpha subunit n=1 Tax=Macrostomum lignano TaxID=282301 RepID=A0A1I8G526_9PLAT